METDYVFHDFCDAQKKSVKIKQDTGCIFFPAKVKKIIRAKKLTHMRVREDKLSGDIHFVFNRVEGMEVKESDKNNTSLRINNKSCAKWLVCMLDSESLNLSEDLSKSDDFATFKIIVGEEK